MAPHLWKHSTKMKKPPSMKMPQCDSPEEKPISTQLYVTKKGHIAQMNQWCIQNNYMFVEKCQTSSNCDTNYVTKNNGNN